VILLKDGSITLVLSFPNVFIGNPEPFKKDSRLNPAACGEPRLWRAGMTNGVGFLEPPYCHLMRSQIVTA